jgi:hypothetical protein
MVHILKWKFQNVTFSDRMLFLMSDYTITFCPKWSVFSLKTHLPFDYYAKSIFSQNLRYENTFCFQFRTSLFSVWTCAKSVTMQNLLPEMTTARTLIQAWKTYMVVIVV